MGIHRALPVESTAYYCTASSVACPKFNVHNYSVVVNYLCKGFQKRTSLNSIDPNETPQTRAICYVKHILGNGGQYQILYVSLR